MNGRSFVCDLKCDSNLAGLLKVFSHPSYVHLIVLSSDGNLALGVLTCASGGDVGDNGVRGVSLSSAFGS